MGDIHRPIRNGYDLGTSSVLGVTMDLGKFTEDIADPFRIAETSLRGTRA